MTPSSQPTGPWAAGPHRLHPLSFVFILVSHLRQWLIPVVAIMAVGRKADHVLSISIVVAVCMLIGVLLQTWRFRYQLNESELSIDEGLWIRTHRTIPRTRIQHVSQHRNFLHRLFGVTELHLESASGRKPEAVMRVLGLAQAQALEAVLRGATHTPYAAALTGNGSANAVPDHPVTPSVLHQLALPELVRLGLISNRGMVVVACLFALLSKHKEMAREVASFTRPAEHWLRQSVSNEIQLHHWGTLIGLGLLAMLAALVLLRTLSVALAIHRYHGFQLSRDGDRLSAEHGLGTRTTTATRLGRLQRWQLDESWLHRRLHRCRLSATVIGSTRDQPNAGFEKQRSSVHFSELAPIGTWPQSLALLRHCLPALDWNALQWVPLHHAAARRLGGQALWMLPSLMVLLWLATLDTDFAGYLPWASGLSFLLLAAVVAYQMAWSRFAAYAVSGDLLLYRSGVWHRRWVLVNTHRMQSVRVVSTGMDRRLGLRRLQADSQGGSRAHFALDIPYLPATVADNLCQAIWQRIQVEDMDVEHGGTAV